MGLPQKWPLGAVILTGGSCNACNSGLRVGESGDIVVSAAVTGVGVGRVSCGGLVTEGTEVV